MESCVMMTDCFLGVEGWMVLFQTDRTQLLDYTVATRDELATMSAARTAYSGDKCFMNSLARG